VVWGVPGAQAIKIATVVGQPNQVATFAYDAATNMAVGKAPARRLSFFVHTARHRSTAGAR
jgi:hypothetical protein